MNKNEVSFKKYLIKYPTIRFYLKGHKEQGLEFEGEFKKDNIVKFINSHLGIDSEFQKNVKFVKIRQSHETFPSSDFKHIDALRLYIPGPELRVETPRP